MTVKAMKETQDRRISVSALHKPNDFSSPEISLNFGDLAGKFTGAKVLKVCTEAETDQESGGSSEEMESPKSVAKEWRRKKNIERVHSQVLRIREEDSHLGKDIGEGFSAKDKVVVVGDGGCDHHRHVAARVDVVLFSRPILPCSPLSRKTTTVRASRN